MFEDADLLADDQVDQHEEQVLLAEDNPAAKYYLPDSEGSSADDDDGDVIVLSANDRSLKAIEKQADSLNLLLDFKNWSRAESVFTMFLEKTEKYLRRGTVDANPVPELVGHTMEELVTAIKESEDAGKESFDDPNEFRAMRRLAKQFREVQDNYKVVEVKEVAAEEEKDKLTVLVETLAALPGDRGESSKKYKDLLDDARALGETHLVIFILGAHARYLISATQREKCMTTNTWRESFDLMKRCYELRETNPGIVVVEKNANIMSIKRGNRTIINGGFTGLFSSLFEEMTRMCQNTTKGYLACLQCEHDILEFGYMLLAEFDGTRKAAPIAIMLMGALHGRTEALNEKLNGKFGTTRALGIDSLWAVCRTQEHPMPRTFLQYCHHLALIGDTNRCRGMMITERADRSHKVFSLDTRQKDGLGLDNHYTGAAEHILFNKIVLQLGLASFYNGNLDECRTVLHGVVETFDWTMTIGQRKSDHMYGRNTPDHDHAMVDMMFSSVSIPLHLHVNTEQVETMYNLCCAVEKAVAGAKTPFTRLMNTKNLFSKLSTRFKMNDSVAGEAQSQQELMFAIYNAMEAGDAKTAVALLRKLSLWNEMEKGDELMKRMVQVVTEASLKVFLFTESATFERISVEYFVDRFGVEKEALFNIVNKVLLEFGQPSLIAFWDAKEEYLVIERVSRCRLHHLVEAAARSTADIDTEKRNEKRYNDRRNNDKRSFNKKP